MKERTGPILERAALPKLADRLGARYSEAEETLLLDLLGQEYCIRHDGITLRGQNAPEIHEAVILSYLRSSGTSFVPVPWRAYGGFPGAAAFEFRKIVEVPLLPHVQELLDRSASLLPLFDGSAAASLIGCDLAFSVRALPKVHLHVELCRENDEFPAELWVLFTSNADRFLSVSAMLQLGELFKERLVSLLRIY